MYTAIPGTVRAGEAGLVGVGHEVIVETVLPGEGGLADGALKGSQPRMAPDHQGERGGGGVTSSIDPDSFSATLWIRIYILNTDPDPHR